MASGGVKAHPKIFWAYFLVILPQLYSNERIAQNNKKKKKKKKK